MSHLFSPTRIYSGSGRHLATVRDRVSIRPAGTGPDSRRRSVIRYCNKENIRRMTLQLCYFRSRGYIFNLPLPTTAAKHCQLLYTLIASTRRFANFSTPRRSSITSPFYPPKVPQLLSVPARMPARPAWPGHYPSPSAHLRSWASPAPPRGHDSASQRSTQQQLRSTGCYSS